MKHNILLCFVEQIEQTASFESFVSPFYEMGMEPHLITGIVEHQIQPHQVITIMEEMFGDRLNECRFFLLSNIKDFFQYMYTLYHETFEQFIFYNEQVVEYPVSLESFYPSLLLDNIINHSQLHKAVYTNLSNQNLNWLPSHLCVNQIEHETLISQQAEQQFQRLFYTQGSYYLFEAVDRETIIVNASGDLPDALPSIGNNLATFVDTSKLQLVLQLCDQIEVDQTYFWHHHNEIQTYFNNFKEVIQQSRKFTKNLYIKSLELISEKAGYISHIFLQSFLLHTTSNRKYLEELLDITARTPQLQANEKYFLLFQYIRFAFVNMDKNLSANTGLLLRQQYHTVLEEYKQQINKQFSSGVHRIPKHERNKQLIFMFTSQFLNLNHGPTKTALDRCYQLIKHMGKQVVLINTGELLTFEGALPFYGIALGNVIQELTHQDKVGYKDIEVPFYQPGTRMPNEHELVQLMEIVAKYKPYMIIGISGTSVATDLCGQLVPVVTISTVNSGLQISDAIFDVIGRKVTAHDLEQLQLSGKTAKNIIESVFTFDFKPQQNSYTRQQLGLPENQFLMALIGGRLDQEVSEELLETLLKTSNTHLVFIGPYDPERSVLLSKPENQQRYTLLDFQEDVLAILEQIDLYINPLRAGGATSAVESLYKGVPVITHKSGDVYVAVGDIFAIDSFEEMKNTIDRYVQDKKFYDQQSTEASNLSYRMMDTRSELEGIIRQVENSELFF